MALSGTETWVEKNTSNCCIQNTLSHHTILLCSYTAFDGSVQIHTLFIIGNNYFFC